MSKLILCDGDWTLSGAAWECAGTVTQIVYSAPVEYTAEMAMEAIFQGFSANVAVMATVFGGRLILKQILRR